MASPEPALCQLYRHTFVPYSRNVIWFGGRQTIVDRSRNQVLDQEIGATWRIPCAAAMLPYVKLLWTLDTCIPRAKCKIWYYRVTAETACGNVILKYLVHYSCKLFYFSPFYFRAAVSECFCDKAVLSALSNSCCVFDVFQTNKTMMMK